MTFLVARHSFAAFTIQAGAGRNAQQTLPTSGGPTGGTFTLSLGGQTTAPIQWNATAAQIQAALGALPNVTPSGVLATGGPLNTTDVVLNFIGPLANTVVPLVTADNTLATGGAVVPASTTTGVVGDAAEIQDTILFQIPTTLDVASMMPTGLSITSPAAVTGATAQTLSYKVRQLRAGVLVATIAGYTLVLGNNFVANTPIQVPIIGNQQPPVLKSGDLLVARAEQTGATGLAGPVGTMMQLELAG